MDRWRAILLQGLLLVGFCSIGIRLFDLMILEHETLSERADRQHIRRGTLTAHRGTIYDRRFRELAVDVESYSLYGVPRRVEDPSGLANVLRPLVPAGRAELVRRLSKDREFIWLARKLDVDSVRKIRALGRKGQLGFKTEMKRVYPKGRLGAHLLGFVNIDNEGKSGVERWYDDYLARREERFSLNVDGRERRLWSESLEDPRGEDLVLTVDEDLQYLAEAELDRGMRESKAKAGVVVMMEPVTGEILALSVRPTYDPEKPRHPERWRNRAVTDMYEPGSTFKAILAAAALEEQAVGLHERFDVSAGRIKVGNRWIRDAHRIKRSITLGEIIRESSNVGAVMVAERVGGKRYYEYIRAFGFGEKTGVDLPGEISGRVRPPEQWSGMSLASLAIGQEIGATAIQITAAYCAIANGGILMRPKVARAVVGADGRVVREFAPEAVRRVISERTSRRLVEMLTGVVTEGGTGELAAVEGNQTAGKTGTAQKYDPRIGRYSHEKYVSSFVGFVPAEEPRMVVLVLFDEPEGKTVYGGRLAGPVFRRIAERALVHMDVPRDRESVEILKVAR